MATITTINETDLISTSRTDINNNFSALNTDKIETSVLDTDTALTANSDSKIATQKAVKAYVDAGGNVNASETTKGIVEEATDAEVTAGTDTGATGAKLFAPPSKLNTQIDAKVTAGVAPFTTAKLYTMGALDNALVKTYFNMQLPFILATGASTGDASTSFGHWERSSTDFAITKAGGMFDATGTGADTFHLTDYFKVATGNFIGWDNTNIIILDWFAKLPATSTGDINMGFAGQVQDFASVYNNSSGAGLVGFVMQGSTGKIFANVWKNGVGISQTEITGITNTVWNNFRIELDLSNEVKFYINGVLKVTIPNTNLMTAGDPLIGFGRSNTSNFLVTAPTLSLQMNP